MKETSLKSYYKQLLILTICIKRFVTGTFAVALLLQFFNFKISKQTNYKIQKKWKCLTELWAHFPPPSPLPFLSFQLQCHCRTIFRHTDTRSHSHPWRILSYLFFFVSKIDKSRKTHFKIERTSKHLSPLFWKLFAIRLSVRPSVFHSVCLRFAEHETLRLCYFFQWSSLCRTFTVVLTTSNRYCNHCWWLWLTPYCQPSCSLSTCDTEHTFCCFFWFCVSRPPPLQCDVIKSPLLI